MNATLRGLTPGRAGLAWLVRRRAVAQRGSDLLEHKLRILMAEEKDFELRSQRTAAEWDMAIRELERWMLRSALLSGEASARRAGALDHSDVEFTWQLTMGVRYPTSARCWIPPREDLPGEQDNSALHHAIPAAARALVAGADHAVATRALAAVRAEITGTRRQLRALRERWLPRLEAAHSDLTDALAEQEHDEHVRLRWVADTLRTGRDRP